ncbi:transcription termination/antitermination protein NusG [Spiroplasma endosymbiont of Labia minor]|uniref:transcription termination/antitermination protein NusG n=1 Tax=Spiroplasma endosymbiont of Labia minor TaxID=3066305 RepID=UPI0030D04A00
MIQDNLTNELNQPKGQWFVINCNVGYEDRVRQDLLQKVETGNLTNLIYDIRIAKLPFEGKNGKVYDKNKFPGYVFVNMQMTDEAWFIVRNTPGVTGFIGSSGKGAKPLPLMADEVEKMLIDEVNKPTIEDYKNQLQERIKLSFKIGDTVVIKSGTLSGKEGKVAELNNANKTAVINIELFGRYVPSEIAYDNIEIAYKD